MDYSFFANLEACLLFINRHICILFAYIHVSGVFLSKVLILIKLFCCRMWTVPEFKGISRTTGVDDEKLNLVSEGCHSTRVSILVQIL